MTGSLFFSSRVNGERSLENSAGIAIAESRKGRQILFMVVNPGKEALIEKVFKKGWKGRGV